MLLKKAHILSKANWYSLRLRCGGSKNSPMNRLGSAPIYMPQ
jgi:hypothetical protein